jgi:hypothetical protein
VQLYLQTHHEDVFSQVYSFSSHNHRYNSFDINISNPSVKLQIWTSCSEYWQWRCAHQYLSLLRYSPYHIFSINVVGWNREWVGAIHLLPHDPPWRVAGLLCFALLYFTFSRVKLYLSFSGGWGCLWWSYGLQRCVKWKHREVFAFYSTVAYVG